MSATQARIGFGIHFAIGNGASPEVFTNIAEVTDVTPPSMTKDQIEATHTDSPDGFREFIPGLKDGGECSITMNFLADNVTQNEDPGAGATPPGLLYNFINETETRNYKITFPGTGKTWTFRASVIGYQPAAPIDNRMTAVVKFKVAGAPMIA